LHRRAVEHGEDRMSWVLVSIASLHSLPDQPDE
jgi:hypothetical protein